MSAMIRVGRSDPDVVPGGFSIATELRHRASEVTACQVRPEGDLAGRLRVWLDVGGRTGRPRWRAPGCPGPAPAARSGRGHAGGAAPELSRSARTQSSYHPGSSSSAAEHREEAGLLVVRLRQLGDLRGATDLRHVDLDLRVQPHEGAVDAQEAGTRVLGLHHGPAQARERALVGAVRPQQAGDVGPGPLAGESEEGGQPLSIGTDATATVIVELVRSADWAAASCS